MFFFKVKTAYEMRISDWSSDVCSSDLSSILAGDLDRCWRSIFVFACTKLSGALKSALSIGSSNVIKIRQFPRLSGVDETKAAHNCFKYVPVMGRFNMEQL